MPPEFLAGRLIRLRPVTASDLELLLDWDADPTIVETMGHKFVDRSAGEWLSSLRTQRDCLAWMVEDEEGKTVGELELAHLDWRAGSAELRVCIGDRQRQNRGYGTDAVRTAVRLAFEGLGLRRVYLRVYLFNTRAIRVYERVGFRRTGLLRPIARRNDPAPILLMTLTRAEWERTLYRAQPGGDGVGTAALTLTNVH
ncbi:MAG TPA: GNAT family protein [Symbiobacteriaceae bacterium]